MTESERRSLRNRFWLYGRKKFLAACVKHPSLRKVRFARWERLRKKYDAVAEETAVNSKSVVFECFGGHQYGCSPKAIYLKMLEDSRFDGWTFFWSFKGSVLDRMAEDPTLSRARLVQRGSGEYYSAFAASKYWIQNNRVPEYITPRDEQVYVQCWHGTPLKRLGCDVPESSTGGALNSASELAERFKMDSAKWTYLLAPSDYTGEHLADAFGLPQDRRAQTILKEGYPRNDYIRATLDAPDAAEQVEQIKASIDSFLLNQHLERIARERECEVEGLSAEDIPQELHAGLHLPRDKKILLYAPTFRDDQYTPGVGYSLDLDIDLDEMQRELGDEWIVLLRMHYYIANKLDLDRWAGFAFNVSSWPDINQLYVVADTLCTDYSSVFFDYSNTNRPLYFLWTDLEHYGEELHGFYLDPMTLPGPKCRSSHELTEAVKKNIAWFDEYGEGYEKFRKEFCPLDDGHAAERVIERVMFGELG